MYIVTDVWHAEGYSPWDHLVTSTDIAHVADKMIGRRFRKLRRAEEIARDAFREVCDPRCDTAGLWIELETSKGEKVVTCTG